MKLVLAIVVVLVVALARAAPQKREAGSCSPVKQFVGRFGVHWKMTEVGGEQGTVFYDGIYRRISYTVGYIGHQTTTVELYNEKVKYVITKGGHSCQRFTLKDEWKPMEVPQGAKLFEQGLMGTPGNTVSVRRFYGKKDGGEYVMTATADHDQCMISNAFVLVPSLKAIFYVTLSNVTRTETTSADFAVPEACHQSDEPQFHAEAPPDVLKHLKGF